MKKIKLTKNKYTIVDDDDFKKFGKFKWYFQSDGYVARTLNWKKSKRTILIHRVIMKCPKNKIIDHINRNTLDNRKINLRICDKSLNGYNRKFYNKNNKAGYVGLVLVKLKNNKKSYHVYIRINKKRTYIKAFRSKKEAINGRIMAEKKYGIYNLIHNNEVKLEIPFKI